MKLGFRVRRYTEQLDFVANQSLLLVLVSVGFAAMIMVLESSYHMKKLVQNDSLVPGFAALLILRELAVIVSGLLLTSRVGAAYTAELALMKQTQQFEALKLMQVEPVEFLFWPRFVASILGGMVLAILSSFVCLAIAAWVSKAYLGMTQGLFLAAMNRFVGFSDVMVAILKGAVFGAIIPCVSFVCAIRSKDGAQGIGEATTKSVVLSSVLIIVSDFFLSWIFTIVLR